MRIILSLSISVFAYLVETWDVVTKISNYRSMSHEVIGSMTDGIAHRA